MTRAAAGRSPVSAVVLGTGTTVASVLPVFLVGALAVQLTESLAFGLAGIGGAIAVFRGATAVSTVFLGRTVDRIGAIWSIRLATALTAVATLGLAITARTWSTLAIWLALAGAGNALSQPAANRLLINRVGNRRLGIAFGLKQSAPPTASMLAGLSVPLIAVTVGWRWVFGLVAVFAVVVGVGAGRRPTPAPGAAKDRARPRLGDRRLVLMLGGAFALGAGCSTLISAFFVASATEIGMSASFAGTLLAIASLAAIATRLVVGTISDRMEGNHLRICAGLLAVGSIGFLLLAVGSPAAQTAGVVIAMMGAWGFNGVFWFALVRAWPQSPGSITGAVQPGGLAGGALAPMLFGAAADTIGFTVSWALAALTALLAGGAMLAGSRRLDQHRARVTS